MEDKSRQLEQRMISFSVAVIKFCQDIKEPTMRPVIDQLIRSATSIGANYSEANNAASKLDFRNKIFIAKKEAAEARYWLVIIEEMGYDKAKAGLLKQEAHELLMILQKIVSSLQAGSAK